MLCTSEDTLRAAAPAAATPTASSGTERAEQWEHLEEQACGSLEKHNLNCVPLASAGGLGRLSCHP